MPKGANFRRDSPQRALDDARIRSHSSKYAINPREQPPELEETFEESPLAAERRRGTIAMREIRKAQWQRPVIAEDGQLVPRRLGPEFFLDHEDPEETTAAEVPSFAAWRIVGSQFGPCFQAPGRLPSLIAEDELPHEWFFPKDKGSSEAILVIDTNTNVD